MQITDWNDLRIFLGVATAPSLFHAARALGLDTSTVSRRLAALEHHAGLALVRRGRVKDGAARLTSAGHELHSLAAPIAHAVRQLERWPESTRRESVRLTAPEELVSLVLAPAVPALRHRAPAIDLELIGSAALLDLGEGAADLALRMSRPHEAGLVARQVASLTYSTYRAKTSSQPHWLALDETVGPWPELAWTHARLHGQRPVLRAASLPALAAAAAAGLGCAILPDALAALDPRLKRIEPHVGSRPIWLVMPAQLRKEPRIRTVAEWALDALKARLRASPAASGRPSRAPASRTGRGAAPRSA